MAYGGDGRENLAFVVFWDVDANEPGWRISDDVDRRVGGEWVGWGHPFYEPERWMHLPDFPNAGNAPDEAVMET